MSTQRDPYLLKEIGKDKKNWFPAPPISQMNPCLKNSITGLLFAAKETPHQYIYQMCKAEPLAPHYHHTQKTGNLKYWAEAEGFVWMQRMPKMTITDISHQQYNLSSSNKNKNTSQGSF